VNANREHANLSPTDFGERWVIDSGATSHMSKDLCYFISMQWHSMEDAIEISLADGKIIRSKGCGQCYVIGSFKLSMSFKI
uniref:Retrovirus-related Pol polyprotein from transposon TNT 1-94-like beta-barrel domain-containing protein n=1 Tax=Anopheles atroparvus TaxID=41427 RepID=A0AAG5DTT5_ANOAO